MLPQLHIRFLSTAMLAALQDIFYQHPEIERVGQTVRRGGTCLRSTS
jgi:hypothetical protein